MTAAFTGTKATAERLDVSRETIRLWCVKGYFPDAFRAPGNGTEWRIPIEAIPKFESTPASRRKIRRTR